MSQMCLFDNTENTEKRKYFQFIFHHNLDLFYIFQNSKTFCSFPGSNEISIPNFYCGLQLLDPTACSQ